MCFLHLSSVPSNHIFLYLVPNHRLANNIIQHSLNHFTLIKFCIHSQTQCNMIRPSFILIVSISCVSGYCINSIDTNSVRPHQYRERRKCFRSAKKWRERCALARKTQKHRTINTSYRAAVVAVSIGSINQLNSAAE